MQESWKIKNDDEAEWWIEKCNEKLTETNRFKLALESKIKDLEDKLKDLREEERQAIENRDSYLLEYFESIEDKFKKKTKTQEKYRLPSGEIVKKYPGPEFKRDETKLLGWIENNKLDEYVETKVTPKWGELKKITTIFNGEVVIKNTGEIVEGVELIEKAPVMEFKEV